MANKVELIKACTTSWLYSDLQCSNVVSDFQKEEVAKTLDNYECTVTVEKDGNAMRYKAICKGTLKEQMLPDARDFEVIEEE